MAEISAKAAAPFCIREDRAAQSCESAIVIWLCIRYTESKECLGSARETGRKEDCNESF